MNATENEFRDYVFTELDKLKKDVAKKIQNLEERTNTALDIIFDRLDALENKQISNHCDVNAQIDEYLTMYDQILTKVSDKYKTMDIRLKKDIATTIFIRLMQK